MNINPYEASVDTSIPSKPLSPSRRRFHGAHLVVFLVIWCGFSIWTFAIVKSGLDQPTGEIIAVTTIATILGPMTGAISRDMQGCCLKFSLSLLPYCAASAGVGAWAQVIRLPFNRFARSARMILWIAGWIGWFMGGIVSFLHSLS